MREIALLRQLSQNKCPHLVATKLKPDRVKFFWVSMQMGQVMMRLMCGARAVGVGLEGVVPEETAREGVVPEGTGAGQYVETMMTSSSLLFSETGCGANDGSGGVTGKGK